MKTKTITLNLNKLKDAWEEHQPEFWGSEYNEVYAPEAFLNQIPLMIEALEEAKEIIEFIKEAGSSTYSFNEKEWLERFEDED